MLKHLVIGSYYDEEFEEATKKLLERIERKYFISTPVDETGATVGYKVAYHRGLF